MLGMATLARPEMDMMGGRWVLRFASERSVLDRLGWVGQRIVAGMNLCSERCLVRYYAIALLAEDEFGMVM